MQGTMNILNDTGHTTIAWDTEVSDGSLDPQFVQKEFDRLVKGGHMAIAESPTGEKELIRQFDPSAKEITVTVPYAGG